jgi:hypothetical protein
MFSGTRRIAGRAAKTKVMRGFSGRLLARVKGVFRATGWERRRKAPAQDANRLSPLEVGKRYFGRLERVENAGAIRAKDLAH